MDHYDVIVVGGGTAGCVLAGRLSEDPARRVLLLEAGPDPSPMPPEIVLAERHPELLRSGRYLVDYPATRDADGSVLRVQAGRVMGGGSSVNMMSAVRPQAVDGEAWSVRGGDAWSYPALLPWLCRIETDEDFPDDPLHGNSGPLHVRRPYRFESDAPPSVRAFVARAEAMGLPRCADLNVLSPFGICASPYNIVNGIRQSTVVAWLDPARGRPNLEIRASSPAISLVIDRSRVMGVRHVSASGVSTALADQVVLAAGVFHSPQLLLLSGVGPEATLRRLGITPRHVLPGVGINYQDHAVARLTYAAGPAVDASLAVPRFRLVLRSDESPGHGDIHVLMRSPAVAADGQLSMSLSVHLLDHRSRGAIHLDGTDPTALPRVETGLLRDATDRRAIITAMEFVRELVADASLRGIYGKPLAPGPGVDVEDYVLRAFTTYWHGVGTCAFGPSTDAGSVVDPELKGIGLDGLWIGDASVLPTVPRANTNMSTIMIAERLAAQLAPT